MPSNNCKNGFYLTVLCTKLGFNEQMYGRRKQRGTEQLDTNEGGLQHARRECARRILPTAAFMQRDTDKKKGLPRTTQTLHRQGLPHYKHKYTVTIMAAASVLVAAALVAAAQG
jgi:hypothetical protein